MNDDIDSITTDNFPPTVTIEQTPSVNEFEDDDDSKLELDGITQMKADAAICKNGNNQNKKRKIADESESIISRKKRRKVEETEEKDAKRRRAKNQRMKDASGRMDFSKFLFETYTAY